jgi:hypothetical protein
VFSSTERSALSGGQKLELIGYRGRWSAIRRSTEPVDRDAAEEGVRLAYRAAGLAPPLQVIWCDGPVALARRAHRVSHDDGPNVRPALIDRLRRRVFAQLRRRVSRQVLAQVDETVNPADALVGSVAEIVAQAIPDDNVALLTRYRRSEPLSWSCVARALMGWHGFRHDAAGPRDLSWLATCDFLRRVLGLAAETEPLAGLSLIAVNAGWIQPHTQTCWLSERQQLLHGDASDRLHHAQGPALRFRDGLSVFAWRGVEVPRWMIEQPERITLAAIDEQSNVQVRRCMIEIMTPQRYVERGGAVCVAEDETGTLWRRTWHADSWAVVEVVNATPEADGTRKHYFLQVPAHLQSAREAVAWTYGIAPDVYDKLVVRT